MRKSLSPKREARARSPRLACLLSACTLMLVAWVLVPYGMEGEDRLDGSVPWLIALGGGIAGERLRLTCELFKQGHGREGVVLTGTNVELLVPDRAVFVQRCGVPASAVHRWTGLASTFAELSAVASFLSARPGARAIVVSDALHMPRLRYLRDRLGLIDRVYFRQSRLGGRPEPAYLMRVAVFWMREPLAYVYYRLRF